MILRQDQLSADILLKQDKQSRRSQLDLQSSRNLWKEQLKKRGYLWQSSKLLMWDLLLWKRNQSRDPKCIKASRIPGAIKLTADRDQGQYFLCRRRGDIERLWRRQLLMHKQSYEDRDCLVIKNTSKRCQSWIRGRRKILKKWLMQFLESRELWVGIIYRLLQCHKILTRWKRSQYKDDLFRLLIEKDDQYLRERKQIRACLHEIKKM